MIAILSLSACLHHAAFLEASDVDSVLTTARVTLTVDATTKRGHLTVASFEPTQLPLPHERQGVPLDSCLTVPPQVLRDGPGREAVVSATCDGADRSLEERAPGRWVHVFDELPVPGMTCRIELDGRVIELPALPEYPDLKIWLGRYRWTPSESDELAYVHPESDGLITVCRFSDDGKGRGVWPRPLAFVSHHRVSTLEAEDDALISVTVTSGVWLGDE